MCLYSITFLLAISCTRGTRLCTSEIIARCTTKNSRLGARNWKCRSDRNYFRKGKQWSCQEAQCTYIREYLPTVSGKCSDIICIASFRWIPSSAFAMSLNAVSGNFADTHSRTSFVGLFLICLTSASARHTSAGKSIFQARCVQFFTTGLSSRLSSNANLSKSSDPGVMISLRNMSSTEKLRQLQIIIS